MLRNLTLNSIVLLLIGVSLLASGLYVAYYWKMYPFALGLLFTGTGLSLCGITNGFTDYSGRGLLFWKFGAFTLALGIPLAVYGLYKMM